MAFWSGDRIKATKNVVDPFNEGQIDCNSYSLRMGDQFYHSSDTQGQRSVIRHALPTGEHLKIPPGQFAYLLTLESVKIPPDSMAFISMKTGIKFSGLINVSGFHVDPGYSGRLVYAVYNAGPATIDIKVGEELFKIWFCDLDGTSSGEFVFDKSPITGIQTSMVKGMDSEILSLQSLTKAVSDLSNKVDQKFAEHAATQNFLGLVFRTLIVAIILGVFGTLFLGLWKYVGLMDGVSSLWASRSVIESVPAQSPALTPALPPISK